MANSIYKVHEMVNKVGFEFDDVTAKKVNSLAEKAAKLAADNMTQELSAVVTEIGTIFNQALTKMGKQPIDLTDMIKMPDNNTISKLTGNFVSQIANNISDGIVTGINDGIEETQKQLNELEQKRKNLFDKREQTKKKQSRFERMAGLPYQEADEFPELKKAKDVNKQADEIMAAYDDSLEKLNNAYKERKDKPKEYRVALLQAAESYDRLARMASTIAANIDDANAETQKAFDYNTLQAITKPFLQKYSKDMVSIGNKGVDSLEETIGKLKEEIGQIDIEITQLKTNMTSIIPKNTIKSEIDKVKMIEEAYARLSYRTGENKGKLKKPENINSALNYTPGTESLATLKHSYQKADPEKWEQQYQALIKFVKEYDSLIQKMEAETDSKQKKSIERKIKDYTSLYEELKPLAIEAENMLQDIYNKANNKPLINAKKNDTDGTNNITEEAIKQEKAKELIGRLNKYNDPVDIKEAQMMLSERKAAYKELQKEGLLTDEITQKYHEVNNAIKEKFGLIKRVNEETSKENQENSSYAPGNIINKFANMFGKTDDNKISGTEQVNESLTDQSDLLTNIKKLTDYIDEEYLSAGKHLSDFLNDIQKDSEKLDTELKEVLTTLRLIDNNGKLTFDIKRNGEDGGGTTHNGALISDDFVLIERGNYESVKNSHLPDATQNASKDGINVAKVLKYLPSKYTEGFFDVQDVAKGHNLFENGVLSQDVVNATDEQLEQLTNAFIKARDYGFNIENGGSNIVYDKEKGFSFYDLEELSGDDAEFWNSLSESEKKLYALEDLFSLFSGINRDHGKYASDPNVKNFTDRIKSLVGNKGIVDANAVDKSGRTYEDIFNDVFDHEGDESFDDELNSFLTQLKQKADAAEQAVNNLNESIEETAGTGTGTSTGTGDASSEEFGKVKAELSDALETIKLKDQTIEQNAQAHQQEVKSYTDDLINERLKVSEAERARDEAQERQRNAEARANEAEEKLNQLKEDIEGRKLVDEYAPGEDEFAILESRLADANQRAIAAETNAEDERQMRINTEKALSDAVAEQYSAEWELKQAREENDKLRQELTERSTGTGVTGVGGDPNVISAEETRMKELKEAVEAVTDAIGLKNKAFETEDKIVSRITTQEVNALNPLKETLETIHGLITNIKAGADVGAGLSNVNVNVNYSETDLSSIVETLAKTKTQQPTSNIESVLNNIEGLLKSINEKIVKGSVRSKIKKDKDTPEQGLSTFRTDDDLGPQRSESNASSGSNGDISQKLAVEIALQEAKLEKFRIGLEKSGRLTDEYETWISNLSTFLSNISSFDDMGLWKKAFDFTKTSVGIDDIVNKADAKTEKETFDALLKFQKKRNTLELEYEKAKDGSALKNLLKEQLSVYDAILPAQEKIILNEKHEVELAALMVEHQEKLAKIRAGKADIQKTNEAKEVERLAADLGKLEAESAFAGDAENERLAKQIETRKAYIALKQKELGLDEEELQLITLKARQEKYDALSKQQGRTTDKTKNAENVKAENNALREQKEIINKINDLYREYGALIERAGAVEGGNLASQLTEEASTILKQIQNLIGSLSSLGGGITPEIEKGFKTSLNEGRAAEAKKQYRDMAKSIDKDEAAQLKDRLKELDVAYKELGQLDARAALADGEKEKEYLKDLVNKQRELIRAKQEGLDIDQKLYDTKYLEAYEEELDKLNLKIKKQEDREDKKDQKEALKKAQQTVLKEAMSNKAGSAVNKGKNTWLGIMGLDDYDKLPDDFKTQIEDYRVQIDNLEKQQDRLKGSQIIEPEDKQDLIDQILNVNKLTGEISELVSQYQRLSGDNVEVIGQNTLGKDADLDSYKKQLTDVVMETTKGKASITGFDAATKTLTYTVKTGKNEFTTYTSTIRGLDDALVSVQGQTKKTEGFIESIGRKTKELGAYFISSLSIYDALNQLRQGITYVREIDSALTELKKVTDETEESYDRFLDTASKTASKVGSTVKDIISSTADWARLNI